MNIQGEKCKRVIKEDIKKPPLAFNETRYVYIEMNVTA
jgi:hypothetical protein